MAQHAADPAHRVFPGGPLSRDSLGTLASDNRVVESLYQQALAGNPTCIIFWLKNRDPAHWRDVQNITGDIGHYILSDRPMTEAEWIEQRTKVIEAKPVDSPVLALANNSDEPT